MSKPATLGLRGAKTKFDEFQAVHVYQAEIAHFVGQFFPFHRLYVWAHEQALRRDCGYTGAQPYWDETLDVGAFSKSIILDAEVGFGGDGLPPSNCIQDGPFASYLNPIGPGYNLTNHCIQRRISDPQSRGASKDIVDGCLALGTFVEFWRCVENQPHGAGHGGIGAQMVNPVSSPGDPLFYLHHAWLDRIWAIWQAKDPEVRLQEIGGANNGGFLSFPGGGFPGGGFPGGGFPGGGGSGGPPPWGNGPPGGDGPFVPVPFDPNGFDGLVRPSDVPAPVVVGDPGNTTTLNQVLQMYGIIPNSTIADVMDIQGGTLCYEYD
ncbi:hypothetical protein QBC38DRAFT_480102 [Podospora fimiseda]|uniref:Tyrosinase copper-binding domain-containing protein n=1 Tax=Podospora fimiseda TaxID=252190 RepID=A0AAN7BNJ6_9PEZI|nr:hypothetical protein QBC38DRAFT_480102 [Podospora fimiseda]